MSDGIVSVSETAKLNPILEKFGRLHDNPLSMEKKSSKWTSGNFQSENLFLHYLRKENLFCSDIRLEILPSLNLTLFGSYSGTRENMN